MFSSKFFLKLIYIPSDVARGGSNGSRRPGAQALGKHQDAFYSYLKTRFKKKFKPKNA